MLFLFWYGDCDGCEYGVDCGYDYVLWYYCIERMLGGGIIDYG